jgi:RNA polymerase sigma-70 factor (sigma-E family)
MEMTAGGVEEIADLERARLGELYLRHGPSGLRLAYLLTGDRQLAEDLVQEAFVRMAGRLAHLREPEAFNAYLRRTIVNLTGMHLRRRRVERAYLRREESLASPEQPAGPDLELREYLWRTLLRLPPRQRAALVLHYYEDLSERDAAEVLHCRPSTYRSLVARGMSALRTQIRSEGDG